MPAYLANTAQYGSLFANIGAYAQTIWQLIVHNMAAIYGTHKLICVQTLWQPFAQTLWQLICTAHIMANRLICTSYNMAANFHTQYGSLFVDTQYGSLFAQTIWQPICTQQYGSLVQTDNMVANICTNVCAIWQLICK